MKKFCLIAIFVFSISMLLMGCGIEKENKKEVLGIEKAQKIEVVSVENPESVLMVIDHKEDIADFIQQLKIPEWSNEDIPSDATESMMYKLYQEDTVKLGESSTNEKELKQVATITTYKEGPYIKFQMKNVNFSFKVPKDVAESFSSKEK